MKYEAAKYFLTLLTFALFSYYGTMIMTSYRVESNLGKDFNILNQELKKLTIDHSHCKTFYLSSFFNFSIHSTVLQTHNR